jgi:hypothetical protein
MSNVEQGISNDEGERREPQRQSGTERHRVFCHEGTKAQRSAKKREVERLTG